MSQKSVLSYFSNTKAKATTEINSTTNQPTQPSTSATSSQINSESASNQLEASAAHAYVPSAAVQTHRPSKKRKIDDTIERRYKPANGTKSDVWKYADVVAVGDKKMQPVTLSRNSKIVLKKS